MPGIGFVQGRLSPLVDGKIQAFPWEHWRDEFAVAEAHGLSLMEWTLDHDRLDENPIMTRQGRNEVRALADAHGVRVESLTGDCFMQAPFYKSDGATRAARLSELRRVIDASAEAGIRYIVVPLVDHGSLQDERQEHVLHEGLTALDSELRDARTRVVFESDFPPQRLAEFIGGFPSATFGINYDIGNSAALGFDPGEEVGAYAARIYNVHVKDRKRGGTTVPLGTGNADLPRTFALLTKSGYAGNFILQTARAHDGEHAAVLCRYRDMVRGWLAASS